MSERPAPAFLEALKAFHDALVELGAPFTFIGGVAVIARGVPRLTVDIDATVLASGTDIESIFGVLARHIVQALLHLVLVHENVVHPPGESSVFVRHLRATETGTMSPSPRRLAGWAPN